MSDDTIRRVLNPKPAAIKPERRERPASPKPNVKLPPEAEKLALRCDLPTVCKIAEMYVEFAHDEAPAEGRRSPYSIYEFIEDVLRDNFNCDMVRAILAEVLGADPDPWPGLTYADILHMTEGSQKEANARGLRIRGPVPPDDMEANFSMRTLAAQNRDWLELGRDLGEAAA